MYAILEKRKLNPEVCLMKIQAPAVAWKAEPGQFIILRIDENGERIPLTIADFDRSLGTVTIIFQEVGATTRRLGRMSAGDALLDFVGPLGRASELDGICRAVVIGGGLGTAIAWPQARKLFKAGADVDVITGFRSQDLIILSEELEACCSTLTVMTDDGSNGHKGFVTHALQEKLDSGKQYDIAIAIGPLRMMQSVCSVTKAAGLKTIVSMNPIMIDGTGMCGGCRLTVDGETKFACVDGPDFDGHLVDFDEAIRRSAMYREEEKKAIVRDESCLLMQQNKE